MGVTRESKLQALEGDIMEIVRQEEGVGIKKESNLTASQARGLRKLQKRISNNEIVVNVCDKSGRFSVDARENYIVALKSHTDNMVEFPNNSDFMVIECEAIAIASSRV